MRRQIGQLIGEAPVGEALGQVGQALALDQRDDLVVAEDPVVTDRELAPFDGGLLLGELVRVPLTRP